jgi:hypothetical protein
VTSGKIRVFARNVHEGRNICIWAEEEKKERESSIGLFWSVKKKVKKGGRGKGNG